MINKPDEQHDLEVTGSQVSKARLGRTEFRNAMEQMDYDIDPENFIVNQLHMQARLKEVAERKKAEPAALISKIEKHIADIENLHTIHLSELSAVRKLSQPHFRKMETEFKRLKDLLEPTK